MDESAKYLTFNGRQAWRAWLENNHATAREAWLIHHKKTAAQRSLSYEEGLEEALCFGWIDGLLKSIDAESFALRYTPRRPGSIWSERNKRRAERLISEGQMTAAGLAKVAEARASGEWEAAALRENVEAMPLDLEQALKQSEPAWRSFQDWPASRKKQYLYWLTSAKKAETRMKRIETIVQTAIGSSADGPLQT